MAKIAEFGFAERILDLSDDEPPCGTPGYVASEILRRDPYGSEVDIWSLGVVCFIVLACYPPFSGPNATLFADIKAGNYKFHEQYWKDISLEAKDFIKSMICVDQKARWTAKQLLKHPWLLSSNAEVASV
jgi:serine/threonine protein kinase